MSFREIYRDQRQKLPVALSTDACKGHTYIVTGANGGLGYECTKHLVSLGAARVIMAVRNIDSGEEARKTVELETGRPGVLQVWQLDLAAFDSVAKFTRRVAAQLDRVDGVVQNAAVAMSRWIVCEKPNEMNMTVNVLSQLLLVVLLMPHLKEVGQRSGIVPRITLIGSNVAFTPDAKACMERLDGSDIFGDVAKEEKWSASTVAL